MFNRLAHDGRDIVITRGEVALTVEADRSAGPVQRILNGCRITTAGNRVNNSKQPFGMSVSHVGTRRQQQ